MKEEWYIIERYVATADLGPNETLYDGPFTSMNEAFSEAPEDGDGYEYDVENLTEHELERRF